MSIDLSTLTSEELFELATRRASEEQAQARLNVMRDQLEKLEKRRTQISDEHRRGLTIINGQLLELKKRRTNIVVEYEKGLAAIDAEIRELTAGTTEEKQPTPAPAEPPAPVPAPLPSPAAAEPAAPAAGPIAIPASPDEAIPSAVPSRVGIISDPELLTAKILELIASRPSFSSSLLKERLKASKFDTSNLYKIINELLKDRRITRQGGDNYTIMKRR